MTGKQDYPLPISFLQAMKTLLGENELDAFLESMGSDAPTSIRLNAHKPSSISDGLVQVPWCGDAYYLPERPSFTVDPLLHAGAYYVQEASSCFLHHILQNISTPTDGIFLDLCAAPGGKSTLLSTFLGSEGVLVANEVIKSRAQVLKENVIKWGLGNVVVTQNDVSHFEGLEGLFDAVIVDAPCSGEGMFRKDRDAINEWSPAHVNLCAARQTRILDHAGALPKAGGYLIYATCTYNLAENEENIRFLAEEFAYEPVRIPLSPSWSVSESEIAAGESTYYGYRFYPHKVSGEGFFVSVLRRSYSAPSFSPNRQKDFRHPHLKRLLGRQVPRELSQQLDDTESAVFYALGDTFFMFPKRFQAQFEALSMSLNLRYFGVELGKIGKNQWIPSHEWALSVLPKGDTPLYELDLEQALRFLRKEDIVLIGAPLGWVLATHKNHPLGWFKNLGNRINNHYPKEWRIRMGAE